MKKTLRYLVVAVMAFCLTQAAAFAAAPVGVQLDGKAVTFTDAEPQIVNDRTFLPFRAVFEAMGAEVGYSEDGTVTATRDGRTVTMTIGSTEATVAENGVTTVLTMDVAPFIDASVNRTYVPVRFAAQALGAGVGWDADARTVVIVDAERELDALLEGRSFTYLEKLNAYSEKFNEGIWNSEVSMDGSVSVDLSSVSPDLPLSLSVPAAITAKGVTAEQTKMEISEKVTVDLSALKSLMGAEADADEAAELDALLKALAEDGVVFAIRGDLSAGKLYLNLDLSALGDTADSLGLDKDTWYAMDIAAFYDQLGFDFEELLAQAKSVDYRELLAQTISTVEVNDAANGYAELHSSLQALVNALADDGFVKSGNVYTSTVTQELEGITFRFTISLTMKNDAVVGYSFDMSLSGDVEDAGELAMDIKMAVDEQNKLSGSMTMNVAGLATAAFDITGGYVKGGAAPATEPPAGAEVVDLMEMLGGLSEVSGF